MMVVESMGLRGAVQSGAVRWGGEIIYAPLPRRTVTWWWWRAWGFVVRCGIKLLLAPMMCFLLKYKNVRKKRFQEILNTHQKKLF